MRPAPSLAAALIAFMMLQVAPGAALAFDVQPGGGSVSEGSTGYVDLDEDLRAQLGQTKDTGASGVGAGAVSKGTGLQFGGGVFSGSASTNPTSSSYDERPWIAPRTRPGHD